MPDSLIRTVAFFAAAIVVLGTGVVLTRSGRPFGTLLLNAHKLTALAAVVYLGVLVRRAAQTAPLAPFDWAAVAAAAFLCVASFASGGLLSARDSAPSWVLWLHRTGTWLSAGAVAVCLVRIT